MQAAQLYPTTTTIDPCDSACQALEQFSQDMARARDFEALEEQGQQASGGQTLDDLMTEADEEDEFDDWRGSTRSSKKMG